MLLRRHDLVWLSAKGWDGLLRQASDHEAVECLEHWLDQRLPLVVGRQELGRTELSLGLPAPVRWEKRRLSLSAARDCVLYQDRFPRALDIRMLLPARLRESWVKLCGQLSGFATDPLVHGSYGWQRITRLEYVTRRSDLDLHLSVFDADIADRVAACLDEFRWDGPRIDGELLFPDGSAVAWREWLRWRRGETDEVLVKRLYGVALASDTQLLGLGTSPAVAA
jgi:phosphoribosyl-dephospho-CoA transferase